MKASSQLVSKKLIKIDPEVHKALGEVGLWGESYSDIIMRLIKEHKERTPKK
jgi:hypothetical protein